MTVENRGPSPVRRDDTLAGMSPARARVLEFLQSQPEAVSADRVAGVFGQHVNTVRGHLDQLVSDGLALRHRREAAGRGRPSWLYASNPLKSEPDSRVREYGALAGALASHLIRTRSTPADEARTAGQEWGRRIASDRGAAPAGIDPDPPASARREVLGILDELGFAPAATAGSPLVQLRRCPLLDVARRYPEVICQVHLGVVAGALREMGGTDDGLDLLPFADAGSCRLILPHPGAAASAPGAGGSLAAQAGLG